MIGFTFQGPDRPAELREIPTPEPGPGEILLRMGANQLLGAANSDRRHSERAIIESGQVNAEALLTHTFPLSQTIEAIEFVASGEGVKVAVFPYSAR